MLDSLKVTVLAEDTVPYESPLLGPHGVSFWLEAERKGHVRRILVAVGQNPDALLYNINQLQLPLRATDAIVLTHCHYDHTRGLAAVLKSIGKRDLPVIAHPSLFRLNFITDPFFRHVGVRPGRPRPEPVRTRVAGQVDAPDPEAVPASESQPGQRARRRRPFDQDRRGRIVRRLRVDGGRLHYEVFMEAVGQGPALHLSSDLTRQSPTT